MKTETQKVSYASYKEHVIAKLSQLKTWDRNGIFKRKGDHPKAHILPLSGENNPKNRAKAIEKYMNFDCSPYFPNGMGLHQYAHHLNSSQTLCLMFFARLIEKNRLSDFVKKAFGINIHDSATYCFEYKQGYKKDFIFNVNGEEEYEGTSFDFHIQDDNTEIFFEIKFTEGGFGKATNDGRHRCKAMQYQKLLPENIQTIVTPEDILKFYQLFRNIIRADNENKYVIFITDGNNPSTNKDICEFIDKYSKHLSLRLVIFKTWQELAEIYREFAELPLQFKALPSQLL